MPLKRSREYGAIRKRVFYLRPVDAWQQEGFHFFVFVLRNPDGTDALLPEPPAAVFAMRPQEKTPVSAVVVTPRRDGGEPEITKLPPPDAAARPGRSAAPAADAEAYRSRLADPAKLIAKLAGTSAGSRDVGSRVVIRSAN